jgi:tRNA 2-selenouridine synthase SelU
MKTEREIKEIHEMKYTACDCYYCKRTKHEKTLYDFTDDIEKQKQEETERIKRILNQRERQKQFLKSKGF